MSRTEQEKQKLENERVRSLTETLLKRDLARKDPQLLEKLLEAEWFYHNNLELPVYLNFENIMASISRLQTDEVIPTAKERQEEARKKLGLPIEE